MASDTAWMRHRTLAAGDAPGRTPKSYFRDVLVLIREVEELRLALLAACGGDEDAAQAYLDESIVLG